jgi:hypothetical protein
MRSTRCAESFHENLHVFASPNPQLVRHSVDGADSRILRADLAHASLITLTAV